MSDPPSRSEDRIKQGPLPATEDASSRLRTRRNPGRATRASGLRIRLLKTSTYRLERVLDHVGGGRWAHGLAGADRESVVNATPHASHPPTLAPSGVAGPPT